MYCPLVLEFSVVRPDVVIHGMVRQSMATRMMHVTNHVSLLPTGFIISVLLCAGTMYVLYMTIILIQEIYVILFSTSTNYIKLFGRDNLPMVIF